MQVHKIYAKVKHTNIVPAQSYSTPLLGWEAEKTNSRVDISPLDAKGLLVSVVGEGD